jgi:hypothetical protein
LSIAPGWGTPSGVTAEALGHMRRTAVWSLALVALWSAILGPWLGWTMVVGLTAGAMVGFLNLWLVARALSLLIPRLPSGTSKDNKTALTLLLLMKWPLVMLALLGILWYLPARPEGVALGIAISLAAASIAWLRRPAAPSADVPS